MGNDKENSKGGNYVGGLLQLFDWNAKSRKKLFSSNSYLPEQSKRKKGYDRYSPTTRLPILNESVGLITESSDLSCASSVINEDSHGKTAPGVVARLMGLDSMPKPFDSHTEFLKDPLIIQSSLVCGSPLKDDTEPRHQQETSLPVMKFQTEVLSPKSAKLVPVTLNRLLSPVKSTKFVGAAEIVLESGSQSSAKPTLAPVRSSQVPLSIKKLKDKAESDRIRSKPSSGAGKSGQGHSANRSLKRSADAALNPSFSGSKDHVSSVRNGGKSISLALQAKANVKKREGHAMNGSITRKETGELTQSSVNGSNVLRQNRRKQNCIADKGKITSTSKSDIRKAKGKEDCSSGKLQSSKLSHTSKHKGSTSRNLLLDKNGEAVHSTAIVERKTNWNQDGGMNVISFTFNAPMTRSGPVPDRNVDYHPISIMQGDTLSNILDRKLKQLLDKVEFSNTESGSIIPDVVDEKKDGIQTDNQVVPIAEKCSINVYKTRSVIDCQVLSPVSVLEHSSYSDSCNSSDSSDSSGGSKNCSTNESPEVAIELSDSASSVCAETVPTDNRNPSFSDIEYVNEMMSNIELSFRDYELSPCLFYRIESRLGSSNACSIVPRMNRRVLFDFVCEFLDLRCRRLDFVYKEILAKDVCRDISSRRNMRDSEIDVMIDKDMSCRNGRWLEFEVEAFELGAKIESGILDSLLNEMVADMFAL